ncbi:MAG: large subunit ribosomal protein L32 [Myxococcota bacterium]|jgi:large subunit ribosomal protein L32
MAVPKKRTSRRRRDMRRAHDALVVTPAVESCPNCGEPKLRHHLCEACGTYRGRAIVEANAD